MTRVLHCAWDLRGAQKVQAYIILLCFTLSDFVDTAFFLIQTEGCGNPVLSASVVLFSTAFAHVVSLHLNLTVFQ